MTLAPSPSNNSNVQTSNDVPVYGLELKAKIGDVAVQTLDLHASTTLSGSAENPSTLINTIKVWDGSNVIATIPVNSSTFTKDSNQVYYVRLSGLNFLVPKDATKNLIVSFSTNSIDSDRVVTLDGYNSSSLRAVSGNGISSFYDVSGSSYRRTHTFKKPGSSTLTLSAASSPLRSMNNRVNTTDNLTAPALNFNVKSETGDSKIVTITATTSVSGETVTNLVYKLVDSNGVVLDSKTGAATITFNNLSIPVGKDVTKTLSIKVEYPATSSAVTTPYIASTTVSSVTYEKPNGSNATVSTAVNGVDQYVYTAAPMIVLSGTPSVMINGTSQNGTSTAMTATFTFTVTPQGGALTLPTNSDIVVKFGTTTTGTLITASSVNVVTSPNNNVSENVPATVTVTAQVPNSAVTYSGLYTAAITSWGWTVGSVTKTQTYGFDDFKTPSAANFLK